jgi:L,D-peptidoglycan transpeptidase YkuD (ErfK/YbiS/YcfS/YnhG family)
VFGYAEKVATKMDYRQATDRDFWIDDPKSDDYNTWVTRDTPPTVSHERMKLNNDLYKLGIVVQYNTENPVKGHGSAIFVHIQGKPGSPTAGCVAMPESSLEGIIRWLRPDKRPLIIMGTGSELEKTVL